MNLNLVNRDGRIQWQVHAGADVSRLTAAAREVYAKLCSGIEAGGAEIELGSDEYYEALSELSVAGTVDFIGVFKESPRMPGQHEARFRPDWKATERLRRALSEARARLETLKSIEKGAI